jgi:hypothetical protein
VLRIPTARLEAAPFQAALAEFTDLTQRPFNDLRDRPNAYSIIFKPFETNYD